MSGSSEAGAVEGPGAAVSVRVLIARLADDSIGIEECREAVASADAGAVVTFEGVVRDHDDGRSVTALSYTAHPTAEAAIRASAERIAAAHPNVRLAVVHRTGDLVVGDVALTCAVASAHRAAAFAACADLVDDVKGTVPIWKEQRFGDGSTEWVASLG